MSSVLDAYTKAKNPGAFSGLAGFEKNNKNIKNSKQTLLKKDFYTNQILPRKNFKRLKVIVAGIDNTWQADLIDVKKIKYENKHFSYILTVIDVFSKFGWAVAIKNKQANECFKAFKHIIESSNRKPKKLHIDGGKEFKGECQKYLHSLGIKTYIVESKLKASIVERFNRTIKNKMWRMFQFKNNKKYIDELDDLLANYNNSYHRSIKNKPININKCNENKTFEILYGFAKEEGGLNEYARTIYKKGDYVRKVLDKAIFEKSYTSNWSNDLFLISEIIPGNPTVYKIKTLYNENLSKSFYENQLLKVYPNVDTFQVLDSKNNKILVQQLNNEQEAPPKWANKKDFLRQ